MGISNTIPPSRLIQPGVVANTAARPTSPFTGQAIYQVDTNQMLIWNGTAWVIPNSPAQNPTGLEYISTTALANTTTQFVGAFTNTYTDYRAVFSVAGSAGNALYMRWLVGTTVQTGNMISQDGYVNYSAGVLNVGGRADQYGQFGAVFPTYPSTVTVDIYSPQAPTYSSYSSQFGTAGVSNTDSRMIFFAGRNIATTQMTGFEITTATGVTLAGTMTLYGYRKA